MKNEIFISSDNIKFLFSCTDNEKDIYLGINLNDGKPLVTSPDKRSKEYVYNAQIITYPQLLGYLDPIYFPIFDSIHHKCYNRDNIEEFEIFKKKYSNLNDVNWEEYAIYHEGDKVILGTNTSALHDVVELIVSDNGYILHHECIDNAGTIDKSLNIPFGSFKDLSLIELKDNFKEAGSKVSWYYLYVSPDKATQIILTDRVICRSRDKD